MMMLPTLNLVLSEDASLANLKDPERGPTVVLMNHQIDTDWVVALAYLEQVASGRLKIMLKEVIKKYPVVGTGAMMQGYIFLSRKWEQDRPSMDRQLRHLMATMNKNPLWLLIYPEGTTMHVEGQEKSHSFALKSDPPRPRFQNLLLPRTTGLSFAYSTLKEASAEHGMAPPRIVDLTVAFAGYSGEVPTYAQGYARERDTQVPCIAAILGAPFFGKGSNFTIHINAKVQEVAKDELNTEASGRKQAEWLDGLWERKERLLDHFQKTQAFPEETGDVVHSTRVVRPHSVAEALWPVLLTAGSVALAWSRFRAKAAA